MRSILNTGKHVFCASTSSALVCNAFEKFLMHESSRRATPFLFVRRSKPIIFVGCNQNPKIELDLNKVRKNNIEIGRLTSGGGSTYVDENTLTVSFIKSECSQKDIHNEKMLDFTQNNNIVMSCLKNFVNKPNIISQKHMHFVINSDKVVHGTFRHNSIHRLSFKFGSESNIAPSTVSHTTISPTTISPIFGWCSHNLPVLHEISQAQEQLYFRRMQKNTMDIKSMKDLTPFNSSDFEAYIISKFQEFYPPNYSSQIYIEDIDMRKGAVHGMSNAWKQRSMNDNPDKIERHSGIKNITEEDMLSIPEVSAMYNIKRSDGWIYQKHPQLADYPQKQILKLLNVFDWGTLEIRLYCDSDSKIDNIECYSDSNNKNIVDIFRSIFLNVYLKDKSQLMESFQTHLCHEIIEDTGAIFIINDVQNWLDKSHSLDKFIKDNQ